MNCCSLEGTNKFFNTQAGSMARRFKKKGLRAEQKLLAEGIQKNGAVHEEILEIGCGVGALHVTLLKQGAAKATGIDISTRMIATAQQLAAEMALQERTRYQQGDFVALHESVPAAEIALLDKVICCYQDAQTLIVRSTAKARKLYAVSYPRQSRLVRFGFRLAISLLKLLRVSFHPYYHSPAQIESWIAEQGFEKKYEKNTFVWAVQVYRRQDLARPEPGAASPIMI
jgi:magnesium-protoporphyrin O-methyltransferase